MRERSSPKIPDQGIPGWFMAFFVLVILIGVGAFFWRISVARKLAEDAGLDPNTATAVTLLSKDGVDATYLALGRRDILGSI